MGEERRYESADELERPEEGDELSAEKRRQAIREGRIAGRPGELDDEAEVQPLGRRARFHRAPREPDG